MASLIQELITTLEQENQVYIHLIPVAEKKTRIIVDNDLKALQSITEQEQESVEKISILENRRQQIISDIATVMNRSVESLTIKTIIGILEKQPVERRKLSQIHDTLKGTIERLVEVNNLNKSLIEQSLEMIEFNMNFIQSTRMSPGNNYTRNASSVDAMVPRTGMFDARQ